MVSSYWCFTLPAFRKQNRCLRNHGLSGRPTVIITLAMSVAAVVSFDRYNLRVCSLVHFKHVICCIEDWCFPARTGEVVDSTYSTPNCSKAWSIGVQHWNIIVVSYKHRRFELKKTWFSINRATNSATIRFLTTSIMSTIGLLLVLWFY